MKLPYKVKDFPSVQKNFDFLSRFNVSRSLRGIINTTTPTDVTPGSGYTVTKNGTGDVSVIFDRPFTRVPVVTVTVQSTSVLIAQLVGSATVNAFRVGINSAAGTPTNAEFHFHAEES